MRSLGPGTVTSDDLDESVSTASGSIMLGW